MSDYIEMCPHVEEHELVADPFIEQVHGREELVWICPDCYADRVDEI